MKAGVIVVLSLASGGCVSNSYGPSMAGVAAEERAVTCKMEKPTGSNRPVKVCRAAPGEFDKEDTQRDMRVLQRQSEIVNK